MKFFSKPIFTGFASNSTLKDVAISLSYLIFPWKWFSFRRGPFVHQLETQLTHTLNVSYARVCDSGRTSLFIALKALGVGTGDEVLVQAYTCVVVINAITWTGATPVYVDILPNLTMNPKDAEKKITAHTKALLIQHTFGAVANMDELLSIARKYNVSTIEDCAHALGIQNSKGFLGTQGDIGMYSFGTDKSISSGRGGALVTQNDYLAKKIHTLVDNLPKMPIKEVVRHLLHWPIFFFSKPCYNIVLGKIFLAGAKMCALTHRIISDSEKKGIQQTGYPAQFPNSLAAIALNQLSLLQEKNIHRTNIAQFYARTIPTKIQQPLHAEIQAPLRYPILIPHPKKLQLFAKKHGILLGDWYQTVIAPKDIDIDKTGYIEGSCPMAETYASQSLNLPTHTGITKKDAQKIVTLIKTYLQ